MARLARNRFSRMKRWQQMNKLISLWNDESGQDLAEYAMMLGLIALAVLVTVTLLGSSVSTTLMDIDTTLQVSL